MRWIFVVAAALALSACGGGSSGSSGPVGPNAQEPNLVVVTDSLTPLGHLGVDNQSGDDVVDLWFQHSGAPFWVDAFLGYGGFIPDGSGWQYPGELPAGLWNFRAELRGGFVIYGSLAYEPGVLEAWLID